MKINSFNQIIFGNRFSPTADHLIQMSQDYVAQKAIQNKNDNQVIINNLNIGLLETLLNDTFTLDAKQKSTTKGQIYDFYLKAKGKSDIPICTADKHQLLNGEFLKNIINNIQNLNK